MSDTQSVTPATCIAATAGNLWNMFVYYQNLSGGILQSEHLDGLWTGGVGSSPIFKSVLPTPLAAINFKEGKEIRIYYADTQGILQEHCISSTAGHYTGALGGLKIQLASNSSIAAFQHYNGEGNLRLHVYCQETGSDAIREIRFDGKWSRGDVLPVALSGSSLAAIGYWNNNGLLIRVYYQTTDLTLREHCFDVNAWTPGAFNGGRATARTPISAVGYHLENVGAQLHVYWVSSQNEIVEMRFNKLWGSPCTVVGGLKLGSKIAAATWEKGKYLRVYYQLPDDSIVEVCNDGDAWFSGSNVSNIISPR